MKKGFTLVEYLVTMSLIGVLVGTFVVSASHFFPSIRLRGTVDDLNSDLRQTQEEAVTTQIRHSLRFDSQINPSKYELIKIVEVSETEVEETVIKSVNISSGIDIVLDSSITNNEIIFSADGGPDASGNITISSSSSSKIVNVSPAGVIKVQ